MAKKQDDYVLLQDITIPKGSVFSRIESMVSEESYHHVIGPNKDSVIHLIIGDEDVEHSPEHFAKLIRG